MKEIPLPYRLLIKRIRKEDRKYESILLYGKKIIIPTRTGRVRALLYKPAILRPDMPVLFDFHGGGFVFGLPEMDDVFCRELCERLGIVVISGDYRLAPEHPYPTGLEDCYALIEAVHRNAKKYGIDPNRMAVCGHSAGANLATVLTILASERREFTLKCQILDYPTVDFRSDIGHRDSPLGSIPPPIMQMFEDCYCEPEQLSDIYVSPLLADHSILAQLPPAIIISAGIDCLKAENWKYAEKLREAGVHTEHYHYDEVAHNFTISAFSPVTLSYANFLPGTTNIIEVQEKAEDAISNMSHFLIKYLISDCDQDGTPCYQPS